MTASKTRMGPPVPPLQALPSGSSWRDGGSPGRKVQENRRRKVTGEVEARICAIACSQPPEGASRWTMQAIADELIRLEVVDYITDTTVCEVMKKTKSGRGL